MVAGKRTGAAKGSRHNKKYWRKGTNIEDIEDAINARSREAATGGIVEDMKDEDIFTVDRVHTANKPEEPKKTRKQQAALDKIARNITVEKVSLPKPTGKVIKKQAKLPRGNAILKTKQGASKTKVVKKQAKFDVWTTDLTPTIPKEKLDVPEAVEHYLKVVKKKQPKTPGKAITSLLPAVEVAQGGASYNPESAEYKEYVKRIAGEEQKLIDAEDKIKRGIEPQWEQVTTEHERFLEMAEGLRIHPKFAKDDDEEAAVTTDAAEETVTNGPVECERLTKEQKKKKAKALGLEKEEKRRLDEKAREKDSHNVYRTKQIHKELDDEEKQRHEEAEARKKQKVLNKLTKRQQLGKGKFVDAEDPFLLEEELTGNLRQIKPQGHVLDDRMKSLQRRNMLPIGGNKAKKLKSRLKQKVVEKRNVKTVVKGSRVI